MPLPHNLRCPVDISAPRPVGVSDRSGFLFYLDDLQFQFQYAGNALKNQRILVAPDELDVPSEFLRPAIFGPEPAPFPNARPTQYAAQNQGGAAPLNSQGINSVVEILD